MIPLNSRRLFPESKSYHLRLGSFWYDRYKYAIGNKFPPTYFFQFRKKHLFNSSYVQLSLNFSYA